MFKFHPRSSRSRGDIERQKCQAMKHCIIFLEMLSLAIFGFYSLLSVMYFFFKICTLFSFYKQNELCLRKFSLFTFHKNWHHCDYQFAKRRSRALRGRFFWFSDDQCCSKRITFLTKLLLSTFWLIIPIASQFCFFPLSWDSVNQYWQFSYYLKQSWSPPKIIESVGLCC